MVVFNGTAKIAVDEAKDLKLTQWSTRFGSTAEPKLDTYVNVDIDELHIGSTKTAPKTDRPKWNEDFNTEVEQHASYFFGFLIEKLLFRVL